MDDHSPSMADALFQRGMSRRQFLKFCGWMAAVLALPAGSDRAIAEALAATTRPRVVWLEFQDCTADSESFLRATRRTDPIQSSVTDPNITSLLLEVLSVEYHETLMAPAGSMAEKSRNDVVTQYAGQYITVVEGSIPTAHNGVYCTIGGRTALSIAREVTAKSKATIALGTCAFAGGLAGAAPNPTGAAGVKDAVPGLPNLVNLPGCPANVVNLVATIVYWVTYNQLPVRGTDGRPTFAYGTRVHDQCPRRSFYSNQDFVYAFGDSAHRQGQCLFVKGCRGTKTYSNCPTVKWNEGTGWPVAAGHGCVGCTTANFWDVNSPFYNVTYHGDKTQDDCASCHR